jgi:hypothetical protein
MSDTPIYDHNNPYQVPHIDYPNLSSVNEITGQRMATKAPSKAYLDNYDAIFRKKEKVEEEKEQTIENTNQ